MQIEIQIWPEQATLIPFSYYHSVASALYAAMGRSSAVFSKELHDGEHAKRVKLFGFTPLQSRSTEIIKGSSGSHLPGRQNEYGFKFKALTSFRVFSPWPDLLNAVGEGLLSSSEIVVDSCAFSIKNIMVVVPPMFSAEMTWKPHGSSSIVTAWSERVSGPTEKKIFIFPGGHQEGLPSAEDLLLGNIITKWKRVSEVCPHIIERWLGDGAAVASKWIDKQSVNLQVLCLEDSPLKTRLHQIQSSNGKGSPVRSWAAPIQVSAPIEVQRLIWACGLGAMNSRGFGGVEGL